MATKIPTNAPPQTFILSPDLCTLDARRAMIGGAKIAFVDFTDGSALMIDAESKLKGLPVNHAATDIAVTKRRPETIAGTAILFSRDEMRCIDEWSV